MFKDFNGADVTVGDTVLFVPAVEGSRLVKAQVVAIELVDERWTMKSVPALRIQYPAKRRPAGYWEKGLYNDPATKDKMIDTNVGVYLTVDRAKRCLVKVAP